MKVLVYGLSACIGGVETFVFNYCSAIAQAYPQITFEFVVYDAVPQYVFDRGLDPACFHVIPDRATSLLANKRELRKLITEGDFDCVWGNLCSLSDIGPLSCAVGKVPVRIVHAHSSQNMGTVLTGVLHKLHQKRIGDTATAFLACSQDASSFMYGWNDERAHQVRIVPNGIDVARFAFDETMRQRVREDLGLRASFVLIYVGRLSPEKNPHFALEVLKALRDAGQDVRLLMLGEGPERARIESTIHAQGLEGYVELLGSVSNVERYLSAADALLMPSLFEGLPLALVEAQASGIACLTSEAIPDEAIVTEQVKRLSLAMPAAKWASALNEMRDQGWDRAESAQVVIDAGFDIHENARELGAWLLQRAAEAHS